MQTSTKFSVFPIGFSEVIADAVVSLPPLIRPQDDAFLCKMAEILIETFWENYIKRLPQAAQKEFAALVQDETGEAIVAWNKKYADFTHDPKAEELRQRVLIELLEKMRQITQIEYPLFTSDDQYAL